MKRLLQSSLLVFLALLLAFSLSGCGDAEPGEDSGQVAATDGEQIPDEPSETEHGKETATESGAENNKTNSEENAEGDATLAKQDQDDSSDERPSNRSGAGSRSSASTNVKQSGSEKQSTTKANEPKNNNTSSIKGSTQPGTTKRDSSKAPKKEQQPQAETVTYSIVADKEMGTVLAATEVDVQDGDTVLDTLIRVTRDKGIHMAFRGGTGANAYVEGINNLYEFDRGQGSGWMYRVNGIFPNRGAGVVPILPGDRVEWLYTVDHGKDLGADLKPFR